MRFRINLEKMGRNEFIPINYQYELSSAIYKVIDRADGDFSKFLHEEGYVAFGKRFRLFTFSRIEFQGFKVIPEAGRISHFGNTASFTISFLIDKAAEEFIRGLFMAQELIIGDKISQVHYTVTAIEAVAPPHFIETMQYRSKSPLFVRRKRADGGEDYLHPDDSDYGILLIQNLISKSKAFALSTGDDQEFKAVLPDFSFRPLGKIHKNGVKIKQLTAQQSMLIGYMFEFEFKAPVELQEIGYTAGFGHLGSQGFGSVEVKNEKMKKLELFTNLLRFGNLGYLLEVLFSLISLIRLKNCFGVSAFDASIRFSNSFSLMGKGEEMGFD